MFKKKTIWAFVLMICLIIPAMFMLTACKSNDTVDMLTGTGGITAEGEFKKGTTLSSESIQKTSAIYSTILQNIADKNYADDKIAIYDISILNGEGTKIQPSKIVKITMQKPFESEHGYTTFHIKQNATVEELETTLNGTNIEFETESFSYFIVVGKVPPTNQHTFSFSNTHADSLEHPYNGAAVFVSKEDIVFDGTKLSEITDEDILSKIVCVWRDKTTKAIVTPDGDITLTGEINTHYGVDQNITIGNEIAGPCVVGEYEFVLSFDGVEKLIVDAKITQSDFQKITTVNEFDATTAPTILGEICYYTIVGMADGKMYVMQMPADGSSTTDLNVDADARLVEVNEEGRITLGEKFDFVFTPMRYFDNEWRYYPETSTEREDLLVDFCTGYYGARTATTGLATQVINRIGWTKLSGDKIARYKEEIRYTDLTYGNLTKFADDGAVTIYAPRKGETTNNALRLVKDGNRFVFTGKDVTTDTRESFPIYVYKQHIKKSDKFDFYGNLDKNYDGEAVKFNAYKDLWMETESGEDIGSMLKTETVRFVFTDLKGNFVMYGDIQGDDVFGPSAKGQYQLVIQFKEKGDEWIDKAVLTEFEIK